MQFSAPKPRLKSTVTEHLLDQQVFFKRLFARYFLVLIIRLWRMSRPEKGLHFLMINPVSSLHFILVL